MEATHDFFDGGLPVPNVDVQDVNKVRAEILQRGFE